MIDYNEIFIKYGLIPPSDLYIPTKTEIVFKAALHPHYINPRVSRDLIEFSAFHLSVEPFSGFLKIADHNRFISAFNLDVDFSRIHIDLFYTFSFYVRARESRRSFAIPFYRFADHFNEEQLERYLTHFSAEYPFKKLFNSNVKKETIEELTVYLDTVFSNELKNVDASSFVSDVYAYILQEQQK